MVEYIPYKQIDFDKYHHCIQHSTTTLFYAEPWFLDIETHKKWDILMANDYEYVMPLTYYRLKRSFWKISLIEPYHGQQLGIITTSALNQEINDAFTKALLDLKPTRYNFNHAQNEFLDKDNLIQQNNFVLDLNQPYASIFQQFSTTRRRWVRKAKKNDLTIIPTTDIDGFIKFQKQNLPLNESIWVIRKKRKIIFTAIAKGVGKLYQVSKDNKIIAMVFFIKYRDRIYYMQSASNPLGKAMHAMDFAINYIIEKHADKPITLDFEGSQIEGIANYMKSYGAINQPYLVYRKH